MLQQRQHVKCSKQQRSVKPHTDRFFVFSATAKCRRELHPFFPAVDTQVYDLMTKLSELAVTSHRPTLRATAGQTFLTFLLEYPLGEKRLHFHLNQVCVRD